ncbi:hypothetical protein [Sulfobacillus thermotolerans]|uniref:hypothetical protein n=1 Tax=Sulfobacillus thermotolerans TaxID=338644 RepID=UPI003366188B
MWPYYRKKRGAQVEPLQEEDVDVRHNQAVNVWNGLLKAVELRLVNPYLGINMVRLGAPNLFLGVMIAVPYLAQALAAAIGTGWLLRARRPKRFTAQLFLAARLGFLLLAAVDFWGNKPHAALWFLLAVIVLNLPGALAVIGWQTLLGQVLPPSGRAQAVMWRQWGMNAIGLVTLLVGGWAIGTAPGVHAYGVMDVIAAAVGIGEVLIYQRFRVGEYPTPQVTTWHREALRSFTLVGFFCGPFPSATKCRDYMLPMRGWQFGRPPTGPRRCSLYRSGNAYKNRFPQLGWCLLRHCCWSWFRSVTYGIQA